MGAARQTQLPTVMIHSMRRTGAGSGARFLSSLPQIVEYKDVRKLSQTKPTTDQDSILIDVRMIDEYANGSIPNSLNIPLDQFPDALALAESDPEAFKSTFNTTFVPTKESHLVLSCQSGRRSAMAFQLAQQAGFKKLSNYAGSYNDWKVQSTLA